MTSERVSQSQYNLGTLGLEAGSSSHVSVKNLSDDAYEKGLGIASGVAYAGSNASHSLGQVRTRTSSFYSSIFDDPNLDETDRSFSFSEESPYPEVRSAVANTDDPCIPCSTIRAWAIGLICAILVAGVNMFFEFRYPSVYISGVVSQLLTYPVGCAAAAYTPKWTVFGMELNPGPFSVKEHVLITIMASVSGTSAYATNGLAVERFLYKHVLSFGYQWLILMSTQLIGFSLGGLAHRILVVPSSMIWPSNLVVCALFNTLHSRAYGGMGDRGGMSRERFFLYACIGSFVWYFLPGYLFQALSYFSWVTFIWPDSPVVAQLFGSVHGLGLSIFTFDWAQIAYIASPLVTPWWSQANIIIGFIIFFWIVAPILHFTNVWGGQYMPILSGGSYDNLQQPYNLSRILNPDNSLDIEAYRNYSPLYISTGFAMSYGLCFAAITSVITHGFLYFRKQIWRQFRHPMKEQEDVHARLMSRYPQVPSWWYAIIFCVTFAFGVVSIEVWPIGMPVWAFLLALVIALVYTIPVGMIEATTNQQVALNVITELIIGYALPGRPIPLMLFKTWGYITMVQALTFSSGMKLGHYMKVPPKPMFFAQVIASVLAGTAQLGVQTWTFSNIDGICTPEQRNGFVCAGVEVYGTASIIWGVIGPERQFSRGHIYYPLVFFFLLGAIAPLVSWLIGRKYPHSIMRYINFPVLFSGTEYLPPATAINFVPFAIVGFIFQHFIRRRHFLWWVKYNYILSAALESGVALAIIVIFFALQYPKNGKIGENTIMKWWGNTVAFAGADGKGIPIRKLAEGERFGPDTW